MTVLSHLQTEFEAFEGMFCSGRQRWNGKEYLLSFLHFMNLR